MEALDDAGDDPSAAAFRQLYTLACLTGSMGLPLPENLALAIEETDDAIAVLAGGGLHPQAVIHLGASRRYIRRAIGGETGAIEAAVREQLLARADLTEEP